MKIDNVRPTIDWYAKRMEKRLKEKDKENKNGWHDGRLYYYLNEAKKCYMKIVNIFCYKNAGELTEKNIHLAIKKCIDGSNFLMMLADNLRDELIKRGIDGGSKK